MTLAKETRLLSLNKSRKRKRPITNRIGEVYRINPAKQATAFPPLNLE